MKSCTSGLICVNNNYFFNFHYMKKLSSLIAKVALVAVFVVSAAPATFAATATTENPRSMHVSSVGKVTVAADTAVLNLTVETRGATAKEAQKANRADVDKLTDILVSNGVSKGDIKNGWYSLYPEYNYDMPMPTGGNYPIKGYIASNSLNVEVKNLDKVSDILDSAVELESVRIGGTSYKVVNKGDAEEKARKMAISAAKAKAANLAKMFKVTLGKVKYISEYSNDAYGYYDMSQQNVELTVQIDLDYEITD